MRFDETTGTCFVHTFKDGVLRAVGHDLQLRVERFWIEGDLETRRVEAEFELDSLRVEGAVEGGRVSSSLSARDREDIRRAALTTVLDVARHPAARFEGTIAAGGWPRRVEGELTLHGVRRPIAMTLERVGARVEGETWIDQRDHGITPYRAALGALKVKPSLLVRVSIPRFEESSE